MGIFVSWAVDGSLSHKIALKIKDWIPDVFVGQAECFVSSKDISAGSVWLQELFGQLENSQAGIVCVTRESITRGWMLFEAGALAKMIGSQTQKMCPLLLDLEPGELPYPLAAFQWKAMRIDSENESKEAVFALLLMINDSLDVSKKLDSHRLHAQFDAFWPTFWTFYKEQRTAKTSSKNTPIQVNNNDILVELRSGFKHLVSMFEREQRLEMQVNCPECGNSTIAEFCNATGATRHIDCDSCRTRFVAHLGAEHQLITKLVPVSATSSSIPVEMMKCPHCGCVQSAPISTQPGTTRHLVCNQCTGNFIVHRKTDGSIYSKGMPIVGSSQTRFETFLRKTKFWIEPSFVAVLIEKACEADTKLMESGDIKTPKRLESAMIEVGLPHSAKTANIFVKILVFGGAFQFEPDTSSAPFYKQFTNPLHAEELVRSIYRGLIYRLRNQFPEMGIESIQELRDALHIDIVELGFPAVNINQELQEVLHLKASSSTEQVLPQAAADD